MSRSPLSGENAATTGASFDREIVAPRSNAVQPATEKHTTTPNRRQCFTLFTRKVRLGKQAEIEITKRRNLHARTDRPTLGVRRRLAFGRIVGAVVGPSCMRQPDGHREHHERNQPQQLPCHRLAPIICEANARNSSISNPKSFFLQLNLQTPGQASANRAGTASPLHA